MEIQVNQRDKFSRIPLGEPTTFTSMWIKEWALEESEAINETETVKEINVSYSLLIALSSLLIIIGATIATAAMFAIYGPAIELGNMKFEANELREYMEWKTGQIKADVADLGNKKLDYVKMIDKIAEKTVSDLKPREAKIVNQ